MNEDMLRWLCTALLKVTGGQPVDLTDEEWREPFDLELKATNDGLRVHVTRGDDDQPDTTGVEVAVELTPGTPVPLVVADEDETSTL